MSGPADPSSHASETDRTRRRGGVDLESAPLTRPEYIAAVVHLYRGELYRANAWRIRLDNTTNWAVITTAGLLTFAFREGRHSHWVILIGLALVTVFLAFEARRFRLADVWRSRVRKIEENFYGPILRRDLVSPEDAWGKLVAEDLFRPKYKLPRLMALRIRFTRNYWPIYLLLLGSWVVHVLAFPEEARSWLEVKQHLTSGLIPWWAPLSYVGAVLLAVLLLLVATPRPPRSEDDYWQSAEDEPSERDPILDV